jgi:hypothetical protein
MWPGFLQRFSWSSTATGSNVISEEWYAWSIKISRKEQQRGVEKSTRISDIQEYETDGNQGAGAIQARNKRNKEEHDDMCLRRL